MMKLGADSVICRVVEVDNFLSVTHTLKDQSGRRINDIQSVDDLLETLPSLNEPIIEAVPYDSEYYDKWARVARNEETSRAALRPVTVTIKSWTLLHSIPTSPQPSTESPTSPRRQKPAIASCKSLDSIIEHYNQLFPPDPVDGAKPTLKVNKQKSTTIKNDSISNAKHKVETKTGENPTTEASCQEGKFTQVPLSPKRKLSVLSNPEQSISPEPSLKTNKPQRKNTLQVPLPTNFVSMQWPSSLPTPDMCLKSTQFPMCVPKKASGRSSPRMKSPDPFFREHDISFCQKKNKATVTRLEALKPIQLSTSSLASYPTGVKRISERKYNENDKGLLLGSLNNPPYSNRSSVSDITDNVLDCRSLQDAISSTTRQRGASPSQDICINNYNERVLNPIQRKHKVSISREKSPQKKNNNSTVIQIHPESSIRRNSNVGEQKLEERPRSHRSRRSRSGKDQDNQRALPDERQRSCRPKKLKHKRIGPPMVQFLDLQDLKVIFDKVAYAEKQTEMLQAGMSSIALTTREKSPRSRNVR